MFQAATGIRDGKFSPRPCFARSQSIQSASTIWYFVNSARDLLAFFGFGLPLPRAHGRVSQDRFGRILRHGALQLPLRLSVDFGPCRRVPPFSGLQLNVGENFCCRVYASSAAQLFLGARYFALDRLNRGLQIGPAGFRVRALVLTQIGKAFPRSRRQFRQIRDALSNLIRP